MNWTEVVTHPLGLAAFALALVFGMAGVKLAARKRPWFLPTAFALAVFVIAGGLFLSYKDIQIKENKISTVSPQAKPAEVHQETNGGPAVEGVNGNVIININQKQGKEK